MKRTLPKAKQMMRDSNRNYRSPKGKKTYSQITRRRTRQAERQFLTECVRHANSEDPFGFFEEEVVLPYDTEHSYRDFRHVACSPSDFSLPSAAVVKAEHKLWAADGQSTSWERYAWGGVNAGADAWLKGLIRKHPEWDYGTAVTQVSAGVGDSDRAHCFRSSCEWYIDFAARPRRQPTSDAQREADMWACINFVRSVRANLEATGQWKHTKQGLVERYGAVERTWNPFYFVKRAPWLFETPPTTLEYSPDNYYKWRGLATHYAHLDPANAPAVSTARYFRW